MQGNMWRPKRYQTTIFLKGDCCQTLEKYVFHGRRKEKQRRLIRMKTPGNIQVLVLICPRRLHHSYCQIEVKNADATMIYNFFRNCELWALFWKPCSGTVKIGYFARETRQTNSEFSRFIWIDNIGNMYERPYFCRSIILSVLSAFLCHQEQVIEISKSDRRRKVY